MLTEVTDRRRVKRIVPESTQALSRVRLRAGRELTVINVSPAGALVEGSARLLPGTNVDVHVTAAQGRVLVRARVLRCAVWTVTADILQYRGALAFSAPIELPSIELASSGGLAKAVRDPQAGVSALIEPLSP
jgi:hypothetical protein